MLRERVTVRRIAGGKDIEEDQPTIEMLLASLRGSGVSHLFTTD